MIRNLYFHSFYYHLLFQVARAGCDYHNQNFKIVRERDYPYYTIHLLLDGCGFFHIGARDYLLKKGDAFIITPGEEHIYYNNSDSALGLIWIEFYGGELQRTVSLLSNE